MPDNIPDTSLLPFFIGVPEKGGAGASFAYFGNGAIRRLTGNSELILLRDEHKVRSIKISEYDANRAAIVSKTLFGI